MVIYLLPLNIFSHRPPFWNPIRIFWYSWKLSGLFDVPSVCLCNFVLQFRSATWPTIWLQLTAFTWPRTRPLWMSMHLVPYIWWEIIPSIPFQNVWGVTKLCRMCDMFWTNRINTTFERISVCINVVLIWHFRWSSASCIYQECHKKPEAVRRKQQTFDHGALGSIEVSSRHHDAQVQFM